MSKAIVFFLSAALLPVLNLYERDFSAKEIKTLPPSSSISYFTLGYHETISDSLWLRLLQDFTYCDQDRGGSAFSTDGTKIGLNRTPSCSRGWAYLMLDTITDLSPRFQMAFYTGPLILSSIIDDIDGATEIYNKAVRLYPNNWIILSRAATHHASELENLELASELFLRAARNGAPAWMGLYASKINLNLGRNYVAKRIMLEFMKAENLTDRDKDWLSKKLKDFEKKEELRKAPLKEK